MADTIVTLYGSTECGFLTCNFVSNTDDYEDCNNGKSLEDIEVKIVDENLANVGEGEIGEIFVRSACVLTHYRSKDATTQNTLLPDGWCRTGDLGYFNGQGQLFVVCRTSFSIMHGENVLYPGWLETRINHHPEVQQVMIVPIPDPVMHQVLCACVVTRTGAKVTAEDLHEFCKHLLLTEEDDPLAAIPKYFLFFDSFPQSTTGKTSRKSLMTLALQRLEIDINMLDRVDKISMMA